MDPVFGRGYSEEIDWCLRSHAMGYQSVLAPSCFVYHAGSGITKAEGLVGDGDRIVHAHQAIIDQRYPLYGSQLIALSASNIIDGLRERGLKRIVTSAAREHGYRLETSRLHQRLGDDDVVRFRIDPDGAAPIITASYEGFETTFTVGEGGVLPTVEAIVGSHRVRSGSSIAGQSAGRSRQKSAHPGRSPSCTGRLTASGSSDLPNAVPAECRSWSAPKNCHSSVILRTPRPSTRVSAESMTSEGRHSVASISSESATGS